MKVILKILPIGDASDGALFLKLKNKLSLAFFPYVLIFAVLQGAALYFYLEPSLNQQTVIEIALVSSVSTVVLITFLLLIIRHNVSAYFDNILNYINEFISSVTGGNNEDDPPLFEVEETNHLKKRLSNLKNRVSIHQKTMEKMAFYDSLTGLPNKEFLKQELKRMLSSAKRRKSFLAVLFLDLDEFKDVNDSLGHDVGDLLLAEASKRMQHLLRGSDYIEKNGTPDDEPSSSLLARLAGDEFTLLLTDIEEPEIVSVVAQRVIDGLAMPFSLKQHEVQVSASIGIAVYPQDGTKVEELLKNADYAMFEAKKSGKNNFQFYTQEMNDIAYKRKTMESNIHRALEENEFALHFHPRIELNKRQVVGFEALLRWRSPGVGIIAPDKFLPVAEETILICEIGNWVFDQVCRQIKLWVDNGYPDIRVSINLSTMQIYRGDTYNLLKTYMALYGISGKNLEIEVTEPGIFKDEKNATELLNKLRELGITIALDDFGTGYSSISCLQNLPLDVLKIDRSMLSMDAKEESSKQLLKSVIDIAHNFGLTTVASGLEREHQVDFVHSVECDFVQGYYFSKPIPSDEIIEFMDNWPSEEELSI